MTHPVSDEYTSSTIKQIPAKFYRGILNEKKMPPHARTAYESWQNQRRRCCDRNHKQYKYYGACGVKVKYGSREFIGWWLEALKTFVGETPTVGRIDHSGHYEFSNITLQSKSDNSLELNRSGRIRRRLKPVRMYCYACNSTLGRFASQKEASMKTAIERSLISSIAHGRHKKTHGGFAFEFIKTGRGKNGKANARSMHDRKERGDESN